jgi:hypothetical protein
MASAFPARQWESSVRAPAQLRRPALTQARSLFQSANWTANSPSRITAMIARMMAI